MPDFADPFSGQSLERPMTDEELLRAIRFAIAAEYEAVQIYQQIADSTDNQLVADVMRDVADEEVVHAGEFLQLLINLNPGELDLYEEGYDEVDQITEGTGEG